MAFTLEDRQAVQDLLVRFAYAVDVECTEEEFLDIFTEDAIMDGPFTGYSQGREGLLKFIRGTFGRRSRVQVRHVLTNFLITGDDREAGLKAYFLGFKTEFHPEPPKEPVTELLYAGHYDCAARKVNGTWKLARRTIRLDTKPEKKAG